MLPVRPTHLRGRPRFALQAIESRHHPPHLRSKTPRRKPALLRCLHALGLRRHWTCPGWVLAYPGRGIAYHVTNGPTLDGHERRRGSATHLQRHLQSSTGAKGPASKPTAYRFDAQQLNIKDDRNGRLSLYFIDLFNNYRYRTTDGPGLSTQGIPPEP